MTVTAPAVSGTNEKPSLCRTKSEMEGRKTTIKNNSQKSKDLIMIH